MQDHPFKIVDWSLWHAIFLNLPELKKTAAGRIGVSERYIMRRLRGSQLVESETKRHERFAAACALEEYISGAVLNPLWTQQNGLSQRGTKFFCGQKGCNT